MFDQYVGQYGIESIEFGQLTLGTLPPTFQGPPFLLDSLLLGYNVLSDIARWLLKR